MYFIICKIFEYIDKNITNSFKDVGKNYAAYQGQYYKIFSAKSPCEAGKGC